MSLLENGGSAAAEQPLCDAFAQLRAVQVGPHTVRLDCLRAACITDQCRS